jgi:hypothetical protein
MEGFSADEKNDVAVVNAGGLAERNSRFYTQDIAYSPRFIPVLLVGLADGIDVVDTDDPFVLRELDIPDEVVEMLD